ncbi:MAG TPA: hypothetical protein VMC06_04365 [Opitutaceae bacterium]|nr:hypothetical protein [Opitutaceae bacterium]
MPDILGKPVGINSNLRLGRITPKIEKTVKIYGGGDSRRRRERIRIRLQGFAPRQGRAPPIVSLPILPHEWIVGVLAHIRCNAEPMAVRRVERCGRILRGHGFRP